MPWRNPPNRAAEYRTRAHEVRAKADQETDAKARSTLLQTADTWERMAEYEDKHNPSKSATGPDQELPQAAPQLIPERPLTPAKSRPADRRSGQVSNDRNSRHLGT
jgi:hypothetical protein